MKKLKKGWQGESSGKDRQEKVWLYRDHKESEKDTKFYRKKYGHVIGKHGNSGRNKTRQQYPYAAAYGNSCSNSNAGREC